MTTIVVGGSGMIGQAIQEEAIRQGIEKSFVFAYNKNKSRIRPEVKAVQLNLFNPASAKQAQKFSQAIYLAGNTDHGLASKDPARDAQFNILAFLNFASNFSGSLVLFSSQSVYYGHVGPVKEDAELKPTIPYGISRHATEMYAEYFRRIGKLNSLISVRPTYIFGKGDKKRRLVPRCAHAAKYNVKLTVFGRGKSFLNPLPVEFVAMVALKLNDMTCMHQHLMPVNLNHPEPLTVLDIIKTLHSVRPFRYVVKHGGEEWPAKHYGDATRLQGLLKKWGMTMPDAKAALREYFVKVLGGMDC